MPEPQAAFNAARARMAAALRANPALRTASYQCLRGFCERIIAGERTVAAILGGTLVASAREPEPALIAAAAGFLAHGGPGDVLELLGPLQRNMQFQHALRARFLPREVAARAEAEAAAALIASGVWLLAEFDVQAAEVIAFLSGQEAKHA